MSQCTLAIWSLVPLPFLNSAVYLEVLGSPTIEACLKDFEHYLASMWNEYNCAVVWTFFGIDFLWDWNENRPFPVLWHCWLFQICWHIEYSTLTISSFRIWNSSAGILLIFNLKMLMWPSKSGKLISAHRAGIAQFSFQSQRKAMPKNAQTTAQLHSSHTLVK